MYQNIYLYILPVKGTIVFKMYKRKQNVVSWRGDAELPKIFPNAISMETGLFSLPEMTLIIRCLKSYKREKRGQKLLANLSYASGEHKDYDPYLGEEQTSTS